MQEDSLKSANLLFNGTFFIAVHKNIPTRNITLAKPSLDISLYKNKFSKKIMRAMNDEKRNKNMKGDFIITEFIEFMVRMASE